MKKHKITHVFSSVLKQATHQFFCLKNTKTASKCETKIMNAKGQPLTPIYFAFRLQVTHHSFFGLTTSKILNVKVDFT